ncbi:imidazole glycerol phosphate synthase subunit HisH [Psychrobacter sp. FDAARGOS_221]|uniref:imidazole glycerol phosphate synthase subunit HisH n=1 Tax=Psychrobacter sp. FDAARGOS_221 TaxID=1975705 RepID=UPI000BB52FCB|nr:imidazole glycerol phosphate synthase subunit HisH [Psychrobacter sp. FDAARGOS_221]PNK60844.1 imidazole glycerol phosphate synthase subunit HisH [Psychrobacter sp. FDAARGOS_221]
MTKIALLDYGMGNLHSASKALATVGADVSITNDAAVIKAADKIVFPGVGAMRDCMAQMREQGIDQAVQQAVFNKPVMAICVGMQALFTESLEFERTACLDVLQGQVKKFDSAWQDQASEAIKIPHMGWNTISEMDLSHPLWQGIDEHAHFYFVHSYYCAPEDESVIAAVCDYGQPFCASVIKDNLFATQFHPEKSHNDGLQLLKNFVEWKI